MHHGTKNYKIVNSLRYGISSTLQKDYTVHKRKSNEVIIIPVLADSTLQKRFAVFPSPAGMSVTKLSLAGNN
jgi:hypothetical protein